MYLLDTNIVSELRKVATGKANVGVTEWAASIPVPQLYLSAITILELELGVILIERKDSIQGQHLRNWLEKQVLPGFSHRILTIDTAVARCSARLHAPDPKPERDCLIGGTAIVHRLTLVTRNVGDFRGIDVPLLNPWV